MRLKRLCAALVMFVCACSLIVYTTPKRTTREQVVIQPQGTPPVDWTGVQERAAAQLWYRTVAFRNAAKAVQDARRRATQAVVVYRPAEPADDIWGALAQCESTMRNADTGNGFFGYFQFTVTSWHSVGGTGYPTDHDYGEQQAKAQKLQARDGWGAWPGCARKLGLL